MNKNLSAHFLAQVEDFLRRHEMPPTVFGEMTCGDPHLVRQIRSGRSLRLDTADRVLAEMSRYEHSVRAHMGAT